MCPFTLLADVTFSSEAAVITIAIVGALWTWSLSIVSARSHDQQAAISRLYSDNVTLRQQVAGLFERVQVLQEQLEALRKKHPGE